MMRLNTGITYKGLHRVPAAISNQVSTSGAFVLRGDIYANSTKLHLYITLRIIRIELIILPDAYKGAWP